MTHKESDKLKQLYELYEQPMYRIAFAVLKNNEFAEDAVSDAFIKIIGKLHKIGDAGSPKTKNYIIKVIKSTSINIYRKKRTSYAREVTIDETVMQIPDDSDSAEDLIIAAEIRSELHDIINNIKEPDRSILLLRCRDELSWREVAQILSLTEVNVRKRFERIRKKLTEEISRNPLTRKKVVFRDHLKGKE